MERVALRAVDDWRRGVLQQQRRGRARNGSAEASIHHGAHMHGAGKAGPGLCGGGVGDREPCGAIGASLPTDDVPGVPAERERARGAGAVCAAAGDDTADR